MKNETVLSHVALDKELRRDIDAIIQRLREASSFKAQPRENDAPNILHRSSRERSIVVTKLQEAVMWLGMDLKALAEENPGIEELRNPYPASKDPSSPTIAPTADGLKL